MLAEYEREITPPKKNAQYWNRHHRIKLIALADRISDSHGITDPAERDAMHKRVNGNLVSRSSRHPEVPDLELMRAYEAEHKA